MAAEVANYVFQDLDANTSDFARENSGLIHDKATELSNEDSLCNALTCAVYNFSYSKYVAYGGKIGFLFHPFLGYVRALQTQNLDAQNSFYRRNKIPHQAYGPLIHLLSLRLLRPLPWTPDSKRMLDTVIAFGKSVGYPRRDKLITNSN